MGTRSFAQVAPTPATIALNAYIYGYGGHSLVTPHAALKQLWWTDERIDAKVTQAFVVSKLRGEERDFLKRPIGFGEGLTDDTYMEWIMYRARRLFLILAEVGMSDQIFGVIDDAWADDDLPLSGAKIHELALTAENDDALNKRFYDTQFLYLLRELKQGSHIDYGPKEHIPMEYVNSLPPAVTLQIWDRVHFPGRPEEIYMRRKYPLADKGNRHHLRKSFMRDVRKGQTIAHHHIASVWASYTSESATYIISDFVGEHTLGTFIDHRNPMQFQRVRAPQRPILLCEWMHCLADALASMHHREAAHTAIRPSNILIDRENRIAFADVGSLRTFQRGKKVNKTEVFNYTAPESQLAQVPLSFASSPPISSMGAFGKLRKMSSSTSSSSGGSSNGGSTRSNSVVTLPSSPITPQSTGRANSLTAITTALSSLPKSSHSIRNFSRHLADASCSSAMPNSPTTIIHLVPTTDGPEADILQGLPDPSPELADIYSLGCVFLDIITFLIKGKLNDFVKFRTTRMMSPTPNGKRTRNDTSFHVSPEKLDGWIDILKDDSERFPNQVYRAVPALLELVQKMVLHQATLRPSAREVRDRIQDILVGEGGIETLCCADRAWAPLETAEDAIDTSAFYKDDEDIATAFIGDPSNAEAGAQGSMSRFDDDGSVLSRTQSNTRSVKNRRRSSTASAATAKISAWRRAFSRS
jgi:serine/threonine protein kinase